MTTQTVPSITDEQLAELAAQPYLITSAQVIELITRLRAAERDAKRWRFVRDKQTFIWMVQDWFKPESDMIDVESLIDAAMTAMQEQKQ